MILKCCTLVPDSLDKERRKRTILARIRKTDQFVQGLPEKLRQKVIENDLANYETTRLLVKGLVLA